MSLIGQGLAWVSLVGSALVAGTLFAFSTFVLQALTRLAPESAIRAMQSINVVILRSPFMAVFLGTGAALVGQAVVVYLAPSPRAARVAVTLAALAYLLGVLWVTGTKNVPLNDALAAFDGDAAADAWRAYIEPWMLWNHVRVAMAVASMAGVAVVLRLLRE